MVAKMNAFIVLLFFLGLETRFLCPACIPAFFFPNNQQTGVSFLDPRRILKRLVGERAAGDLCCGEALQLVVVLLSSLMPLSLELSLPQVLSSRVSSFRVPSDPCENWQIFGLVA